MKKFFSRQVVIRNLEQCLKRFPAAVGFITLLSVFLLILCWGKDDLFTSRQTFAINYYLSVGCLLSLSLRLWGEEVRRKRIVYTTGALLHLLLLADAAYLYQLPQDFPFLETGLAHASALTALGLSIFTLPFFREKDDIASWNFTLHLTSNAVISWAIGGIMCGGLSLLTASISGLFGLDVNSNFYDTWLILFGLTLPVLLFLGQIPAGEDKHDRTVCTSVFLRKVIRYLFLPLLGCYLLVLYLYVFKILIQWELPDGWVSWLVTVLTAGCIGVEFCLYPSLRQDASPFERHVARWLPVAILPLLVLMTVGIARRFNDYGITLNRLYLLTLNIWFYIVCIGLFILRERRIRWIAVTFAGIFLLTSVSPINYAHITHRYLYETVSTLIQKSYKGKLPMNSEQYLDWLASLPSETALQTNSRLRILENDFNDKEIYALIPSSSVFWEAERYVRSLSELQEAVEEDNTYIHFSATPQSSAKLNLTSEYSEIITYYQNEPLLLSSYWKEDVILIELTDGDSVIDTAYVRPSDIRKWKAMNTIPPQELTCKREGNRFILTGFSLNGNLKNEYLHFTYSGYYLIK